MDKLANKLIKVLKTHNDKEHLYSEKEKEDRIKLDCKASVRI